MELISVPSNFPAVGTRERRDLDKQMIKNPKDWPQWPILPIKRSGHFSDPDNMGFGLITPDYPTVVIHLLLFQVDKINLVIHQLAHDGEITGAKTTQYQDIDGLLDDGWTVD
jgi:hypothetical protein